MPSFLQLPADMPWWATLAIVVPGAIYALLLLAMPFSVFGLKSRLDQIEAQLDDIQHELRALAGRMQPAPPPAAARRANPDADLPRLRAPEPEPMPIQRPRAEPRLDWPR
jgi:hypothetical protein